ncbi:putative K domain-containing protein [Helianthus annuus]|nr:putative K domain-containing protein [Helianthus annuus]
MEPNPQFDKYAKAKIEDPNLRLPKAMLKPNADMSTGELCYMKIFEDDLKKTKHLAEEIAAGAKLDRKVYRIRNMEILKAIGDAFEDMHQIHKASKATIGLLVDSESNLHRHSFIDLVGTVEQVKTAEELILDKILKTYQGPVFPVILMPPTVHGHEIILHVDKVARLLGENGSNALAIEVVSGAWLQVDDQPLAGCPKHERRVNVYGPKAHVFKAVSLIHSQVYEAGESLEAEDELEMLFKELSFDEMMAGMKSRNPQMADFVGAASASASGSGQTKEEKEQHVEDAKDKDKSEGEKLQQDEDVKVAEDKDESKGKAKQQHEEDVKEAVSGKASETKASVEQLD